ncbi:EAL domain-containing response regulator [Cupriavidus necator]
MHNDIEGMKVLVVDDDPFVLKLLTSQLTQLGFRDIVTFERAPDALDLIEKESRSIGLIFSDLQMPDMDGIEFVRHLVGTGYTGGLLLVSGEDPRVIQSAEKLAKIRGLNVVGALRKPASATQLKEQLQGKPLDSAPASPAVQNYRFQASDLRRAINAGEIVNYYQPKVSLQSAALVGMEALVRWQHPHAGLVAAAQFIDLAEDSGLITGLTRVVLTSALHQARCWQDAGLPLTVAVNLSTDSLATLDLPDFIERTANQAGVSLSRLILEITESRVMAEPMLALDVLTRLRLKRIALSIDDFGTGYSTLAQLRDLPFDELKLDCSFVHGAWREPPLRTILEATLGMARELGVQTVAEGVEDMQDWQFLRGSGCNLAQGYFIGRPMPAGEVEEWIASWERRRAFLTC